MKSTTPKQQEILNSLLDAEWHTYTQMKEIINLHKWWYGTDEVNTVIEIIKTWND